MAVWGGIGNAMLPRASARGNAVRLRPWQAPPVVEVEEEEEEAEESDDDGDEEEEGEEEQEERRRRRRREGRKATGILGVGVGVMGMVVLALFWPVSVDSSGRQ